MPWSTNRPKHNPRERGYDATHRAERRRRLKQHTETDPCGKCGQPLGHDRSKWHLPHNEQRTGYYPGFWCARCNILDGAHRGARIARARQLQTKLTW
jgi:hypothetical protein